MNELISLTQSAINGELQQTVNARELHKFLDSKRQFVDWIKNRIEKYGFVENQDYITFSQNNEKGRPSQDYHITLDMAKQLAMVENNNMGMQARQYFIACEKQLHEQKQASVDKSLAKAQVELLNTVIHTFGNKLSPPALEALLITSSEKFLGLKIDYRPPVAQQTYSASEIGERLGISGNKVGRLTKAHNLKTEEYGIWVLDQSAHSSKQVTSFRYYESVVPVLKALINN